MIDPQRIVDDIRSFVHASDQTNSEPLKALASDYAATCQEANGRLRRCDEFLRQGLRSEAIHFAEAEPNLLDMLALLDFRERDQWAEIAASYGLPAPPALRLEIAQALNRAYAEEQPLEQLLRCHRRLALARSPLGERLAVLRQIAQLDRGNPIWTADTPAFESVRSKQIAVEARQSYNQRDFGTLNTLWAELTAGNWVSPPPTELVSSIMQLVQADATGRAKDRLREVAAALEEAFNAMDVDGVRGYADEWKGLTQEAGVQLGHDLALRVAPVLKWLARQDKVQELEFAYQAALDAFERALTEPEMNEEKLAGLYNEVLRLGREGVPGHVEAAFHRRLTALRRTGNRRERLILALTFAAGAIVLVGFLLFVRLWRR